MKTTERPHDASEHVHEETLNDVGDVLNQIAPYWRPIVGVTAVAVTGIALFGFISNNRKRAEEQSWATYFEAIDSMNPQALQELAQSGSGSVVPWAYHAAAQGRLAEGMQSLYTDREQARSTLEEAATGFQSAIAASENVPLLNQRSMWGFAQAQEGLNELEKAKTAYQSLLDRWPESPLAKRAQDRIASLNEPGTQDFYRWFFAQKPSAPADLPFTTDPETFTIPDEPDVTIPDISIPGDAEPSFPPTDATEEDVTEEDVTEEDATEEASNEEASTEEFVDEDAADTSSEPEATEPEDVVDEDADATDGDEPAVDEGEAADDTTSDDATSDDATSDDNDGAAEIEEKIESEDDVPAEVTREP